MSSLIPSAISTTRSLALGRSAKIPYPFSSSFPFYQEISSCDSHLFLRHVKVITAEDARFEKSSLWNKTKSNLKRSTFHLHLYPENWIFLSMHTSKRFRIYRYCIMIDSQGGHMRSPRRAANSRSVTSILASIRIILLTASTIFLRMRLNDNNYLIILNPLSWLFIIDACCIENGEARDSNLLLNRNFRSANNSLSEVLHIHFGGRIG